MTGSGCQRRFHDERDLTRQVRCSLIRGETVRIVQFVGAAWCLVTASDMPKLATRLPRTLR